MPVEQTAKGAGGAKGSARSEEAAAKREQAKRARQNAAASTLAAKAVSQIQPKLDQVTKLLKSSGDKVTSEHRESLEACQTQMSAWLSTSRQVVTGYGAGDRVFASSALHGRGPQSSGDCDRFHAEGCKGRREGGEACRKACRQKGSPGGCSTWSCETPQDRQAKLSCTYI